MTIDRIWKDPVWSKVIAALIVAALAMLASLITVNPCLRALAAFVTLAVGSYVCWRSFRFPIAWDFEGFLGWVGGGGDLRIIGFQAKGKNRSQRGIPSIAGFLVSNIDNAKSGPMCFVIEGHRVPASSIEGIPPGASFQVMIPLCDMAPGYDSYLKEYEFLQRWGSFRFVVELDGHRYERSFASRQVTREVERARAIVNPLPVPQVRIKP